MKAAAQKVYKADNSGPYRKPHPRSNVAPHNRVDYLTHNSLIRGFMGAGLLPAFNRYQRIFTTQLVSTLNEHQQVNGWISMPDIHQFFRDNLGRSVVESFFGPLLLKTNPTFMQELWEFDDATPSLSKRLPRWLIPRAYRVRDSLLGQILAWYENARAQFKDSLIDTDGNGDPCWGSEMMRERQEFLLAVDGQDDESLASSDLGLIWVSVTNLVPSVMMMALHVFADPVLLRRLRKSLRDVMTIKKDAVDGEAAQVRIDMDRAIKNPLLQAVYAETLRLHVQAFVTRSSAHESVSINQWWLEQEKVVMVNSYPNHMDKKSWNEGLNGVHPVETFWPDRFLRDPADPQSGPMRVKTASEKMTETANEPFFSLSGLEGMWIPYGGGTSACPGRVFAKRVMLYTCAYLVSHFDIDIQADWEMDSSSFGLGTQKPKGKVPFAIRRRSLPLEEMQ
ncbi:cytochrome P450 [Penicillium longicatenatum]|uniref:cytochrome P450 n=1 Tax=Penicillium longicatenatum TaxID=1561947 RepID=UPI002547FBBD|nr:cytochrome P450 [Penicillium longicatenatum]KAJ5658225.1 cytochrome P450 [Penicillium longicatenatum]